MSRATDADALYATGQYGRALHVLELSTSHRTPTLDEEILKADLFSLVGEPKKAVSLAEKVLRQRGLSPLQKCRLLEVLGRCLFRIGQHRQGLDAYKNAIELAERNSLTTEECRLRVRLFYCQIHWLGPQQAAADVSQLRRKVHHVSNPALSARFQLGLVELAAKLGLLPRARRHLETAKALLDTVDDRAVHGHATLTEIALEAFEGNPSEALQLAFQLAPLADEIGDDSLRFGVLGNLAHLLGIQARYGEALQWLQKALHKTNFGGGIEIPLRDTLMQIYLWNESLDEAGVQAEVINSLVSDSEDADSFYGLWHLLTRVKWLYRTGDAGAGVDLAMAALPRIERMADRNLLERMTLLAADGLGRIGKNYEAAQLMASAVTANADPPLEIVAEASRVAGHLTAAENVRTSLAHFDRARRILDSAGNLAAVGDIERDLHETFGRETAERLRTEHAVDVSDGRGSRSATAALTERVAVLMDIGAYPPLLAEETWALLIDTDAVTTASLIEANKGKKNTILKSYSAASSAPSPSHRDVVKIVIGDETDRQRTIELIPRKTATARTTILAIERLVQAASAIAKARQDRREQAALWPEHTPEQELGLVCSSERMLELIKTIRRVAPSNLTVLITGETGVGKELFARALHMASPRKDRPFIPFNCTAFPKDMLDSQLFGHRRGAFTGAHEEGPGVIRAAAGGTLFLDEIGEMSAEAQPKLLRFLESGEIHPIGEPKPTQVDVRIVAATNANLDQLVSDGKFREDLFYRLNVLPIQIPPLRERREEVPALVEHFLEKFGREMQKPMLRVADETLEYLLLYRWPGNVRQLTNELRRMVALAEPGAILTPAHLSKDIVASRRTIPIEPSEMVLRLDQPLADATDQLERAAIERALTTSGGNNDQAAKLLGLSRKGLYLKRQRLGLK
jgi:transcriptional regulator with PAS, ATPase and Fis domain